VLGLRWFRDRASPVAPAHDHGISRATAYRYLDEVTEVLAAQAPDLRQALERAAGEGLPHMILDGKIIPADRCREKIILALNGLRASEATDADIEALGVERGTGTLVITRKGGKVVTIPLAPRTARAIDLAIGERCEGPVFFAPGGRRLDRHGAGRIVRCAGIAKTVGRTRCGMRSSPRPWTVAGDGSRRGAAEDVEGCEGGGGGCACPEDVADPVRRTAERPIDRPLEHFSAGRHGTQELLSRPSRGACNSWW